MKLLFLTAVTTIPTEEGQKRIQKAVKKNRNSDGDEDFAKPGTSAWFKSMNITPPSDLEEDETEEIDENGYMLLPEDEVEYEFNDLIIDLEEFQSCVETSMISSILTTKSGDIYEIEETPEMIYYMIHMISRPWYQKLTDWVKEIKWKKTN